MRRASSRTVTASLICSGVPVRRTCAAAWARATPAFGSSPSHGLWPPKGPRLAPALSLSLAVSHGAGPASSAAALPSSVSAYVLRPLDSSAVISPSSASN